MTATLGTLIRQRRMELGLTQEELAARVGDGVRQAEISRLERDRISLPRRGRLEQIAAALELPLGLLLARSGWTGAEEEFAAPVPIPHKPDGPSPTPEPPRTVLDAEPQVHAMQPGLYKDVLQLSDALARSQDLKRDRADLFRRAEATFDAARRAVGDRQRDDTSPPDPPDSS